MYRKKLLIINKGQFGYLTDSYKYCEFLKKDFNISFICFDTGKKKYILDGVKIIYLPYDGSILFRAYRFISTCRNYIKNNNFDLIFINYLQGSALIKLGFNKNKFIVDVRTGAVGTTQIKRNIYNYIMRVEANTFDYITIISECLRKKLKIRSVNTQVMPLGADRLSSKVKSFKKLKLIYIGTLDSRNIYETIIGLKRFMDAYPNIEITYDIFGSGYKINEDRLNDEILSNDLTDIVTFHGRKEHNELQFYFDECNVGVSYIPITEYFDCQPPTKTYEYINSGMFCIATKTQENIKLISKDNGVLCMDNPEAFYEALAFVYKNIDFIIPDDISGTLNEYTWKNIVDKKLKPILNNIIMKSN